MAAIKRGLMKLVFMRGASGGRKEKGRKGGTGVIWRGNGQWGESKLPRVKNGARCPTPVLLTNHDKFSEQWRASEPRFTASPE